MLCSIKVTSVFFRLGKFTQNRFAVKGKNYRLKYEAENLYGSTFFLFLDCFVGLAWRSFVERQIHSKEKPYASKSHVTSRLPGGYNVVTPRLRCGYAEVTNWYIFVTPMFW